MAKILILESSTEVCSVALSENGRLLDLTEDKNGQNHARLLTVFAEELLKKNRIQASDIDAVAVSKGPGSYTGLRIGVSVAKGFCYANHLPLIAISTLEAMAHRVLKQQKKNPAFPGEKVLLCPMIDARRMEVYACMYNQQMELIHPVSAQIVSPGSFAKELDDFGICFFGNGASKCKEVINHPNAFFQDDIYASAADMCELAEIAYTKQQFENVAYFEPFYLKDFIAIAPKNNVLGR